nr:efflux RND transporter periplasmic adaptor subunit [Prochlorococcus marinus]
MIFLPLSIGISSCSQNKKLNSNSNIEITSDFTPVIEAVAALGQLSPAGDIRQLSAPISQFGSSPRLSELLVKEGDFVKKGSVLAVFENREKLVADLEKKNNLIKTNILEISLKEDQIKRYELAVENSAYSLIKLSQRKDELLKLQKQKIINVGDKKNIEIDLFNSQLRSPIDGYILDVNTRVGERSKNEGILDIGSSQNMEALIEVYESDINRVFISQNVELSSENGGFKKILKGEVIRISPQVKQRKVLSTDPTGDADARIIEVLVKLNPESIKLVKNYTGMKVIAKFLP